MTKDDKKPSALDSALASLRANAPAEKPKDSSIDDALASLKAAAPAEKQKKDSTSDVLAGLSKAAPSETPKEDKSTDVLAGLAQAAPKDEATKDDAADVLGAIKRVEGAEAEDKTDEILSGIEARVEETAEDNASAVLDGIERVSETETADNTTGVLDGIERVTEAVENSGTDDILAGLEQAIDDEPSDTTDDVLSAIPEAKAAAVDESLDDILADLEAKEEPVESDDAGDILADLAEAPLSEEAEDTGLDDILADLGTADNPAEDENSADDILADLTVDEPERSDDESSVDDLLNDIVAEDDALESVVSDDADDLDALLSDLEGDDEAPSESVAGADDLGDLLGDLADDEPEPETSSGDGDLDDLLGDLDAEDAGTAGVAMAAMAPFGTLTAERPDRKDLHRPKFRMALFGDFTGRAARGLVEPGDALASRKPILLDVDTVEDIIESFATTLTLPIGKDGMGIEVNLKELDDLHPDELYEKIEIFDALNGLRQQLSVGSMAANAQAQLKAWGEAHGTPVSIPKRSASTSVPPNLKLSDFQSLIGDTSGTLAQKSPAEDIIARVVGPHIVKAPDEGAAAMLEAVDAALSSAMRLVLHHPDFQAVESQWRSLDMLARRIETDSKLEIVLFDVSAEELAVDLAAQEDLSESGLFRLLNEPLDPEVGEGGFSALFGLYTFEETPPHAELLARIAKVAQHVDAPFFTAMTPGYLEVEKEDRHPLTAEAWDTLKDLPEAGYLGLASPRFLLRLPYGAKTEPCYEFDFEEFTPQEGLSGMLWANPVVLVAVLLAATYKKDGKAMNLGSLMSLGDMPFHYVNDRYGDQVALPCTERNLSSGPTQTTLGRGFMPLVWVKGKNEVRLGSFRSFGGDEIAGPWSDAAPSGKAVPPPDADITMDIAAGDADEAPAEEDPLEDLDLADLGTDDDDDGSLDDILSSLGEDDDDDDGADSLDDLLASFADDDDDDGDDDEEMDPELAALLEGL